MTKKSWQLSLTGLITWSKKELMEEIRMKGALRHIFAVRSRDGERRKR